MRRHASFTLVEMMIVVAIIAVLAAIAIPQVYYAEVAAKTAEAMTNVDGIDVNVSAYQMSKDIYPAAPAVYEPRDILVLNKKAVSWVADAEFNAIGFKPDGSVRCTYRWLYPNSTGYDVEGVCDVDGDGVRYAVLISRT